ncbi:hypothetical protein Spb1_10550 [Planctopirus ephydatiae]|uniref:Uncharacterized protein n=1 Tax=Planctopirus ephydatiae TaxID=2528019 RepID=A0A518GKL1_9PLAN|nr:hypothetical protein [Planctopirus ephydatiae]QDV29185.1 hypothetical protein Spb1_10550 [Planctopirus ephydatiae]
MFKISFLIAAFAGLMVLCCAASAEDKMEPEKQDRGPKETKTTAEIVKALEELHRARLGQVDEYSVSTAEFSSWGRKVFVAWHCPYSGVNATNVFVYQYDAQRKVWERKIFKIVDHTHGVSVEFGDKVTVRDESRKVVYELKLLDE